MIHADSQSTKYQTRFSNGEQASLSDTTVDKGGSGLGFRPHELLEAALACCMNMSLRMCAERLAIPLAGVSVAVTLDRSRPDEPVFEYGVTFGGDISEPQKAQLLSALESCPVRNTLSSPLAFRLCRE